MSATPNSLFRHYLDSLIQRGTTRTSLTDEARNVLRTWYVASRQGRPSRRISTRFSGTAAPAGSRSCLRSCRKAGTAGAVSAKQGTGLCHYPPGRDNGRQAAIPP